MIDPQVFWHRIVNSHSIASQGEGIGTRCILARVRKDRGTKSP